MKARVMVRVRVMSTRVCVCVCVKSGLATSASRATRSSQTARTRARVDDVTRTATNTSAYDWTTRPPTPAAKQPPHLHRRPKKVCIAPPSVVCVVVSLDRLVPPSINTHTHTHV